MLARHRATVEEIDFANFDAAVSTQRWRLPATTRPLRCGDFSGTHPPLVLERRARLAVFGSEFPEPLDRVVALAAPGPRSPTGQAARTGTGTAAGRGSMSVTSRSPRTGWLALTGPHLGRCRWQNLVDPAVRVAEAFLQVRSHVLDPTVQQPELSVHAPLLYASSRQ